MKLMAKLVRVMWVPVILVAIYTGWILWQRYGFFGRNYVPVELDPMAKYGTKVKILQFYASPREIAPGSKALICYGVVNTRSLRIDPPIEKMWPAVSRCFDAAPGETTRYTLVAEGSDHATASESIEITVKR